MIEIRAAGPDTKVMRGRVSTFNDPYNVRSFREVIAPGAFTRSLSRSDLDVILNVQHNDEMPLARTPATLRLTQTSVGLEFEATLDMNDALAQQAVSRVERGVLKECSFRFRIPPGGDSWSEDGTTRTVKIADIHRGDVALTVYGANPNTGAQVVRSAGSAQERRALALAVTSRGIAGTGWDLDAVMEGHRDSKKSAIADAQVRAAIAQGDALEAQFDLHMARYRAAHPLPHRDLDAVLTRSRELEAEALALINKHRSLR